MSKVPTASKNTGRTPAEDAEILHDPIDSLMRALAVLRYRWLVLLACTIVSTLGGVLVISTMQPYWRATATLVVNVSSLQVLDSVQGLHDDDSNQGNDYLRYAATQREIIKSRRIAEASLKQLGLGNDPVFLGVDKIQNPVERQLEIDSIDPAERLSSFIEVNEILGSRLIRLSAEYPDAGVAKEIADVVTNSYLDYISRSREESGTDAQTSVADERARARTILEKNEASLDKFKQEHRITSISLSDRQNLIAQSISTLTEKTKHAEADLYAIESIYEEAKQLREAGRWATASLVESDQRATFDELVSLHEQALQDRQNLNARYGPRHPKIIAVEGRVELIDQRLDSLAQSLLEGLRAKRDAARRTEAKLRKSLYRENERALDLGRLEPEYRALEREATTAASTYEVLARRDAELGVSNRVELESKPPVELLDRATVTKEPVRPRKTLILLAALFTGLVLGSIVALSMDLRDQRIRGTTDLKRILDEFGMPMLGHVPVIQANPEFAPGNVRAQKRFRDLYTFYRPQSHIAERCRAIRTSVTFSLNAVNCPVLLVTSPASGDGKSSFAINLATSFTQANKSVLILGADMRRPRLHSLFPQDQHQDNLGLSSVLSGASSVDEALRHRLTECPERLSLLTCGPVPENPAELLESAAFRETLATLRRRFDVIIIDSPPVLPVIDPVVIAAVADAVIVVARCRTTTREQLRVALTELRQVDTNILGVVLNDLSDSDREGGYTYAQTYYRDSPASLVEDPARTTSS